ncbi:helix-turn-helix domain-containing protein [Amycolatopsis minnesotensis]|uniref:Helix-turn-helix domain-containing protein n=1 Tax=Amycolatopsis minnesotensis TaxID=337894 RepID=A0ABP5DZ41_9PSEU
MDDGGARIAEKLASSVLQRVPALTDALVRVIEQQNPGYRRMNVVPDEDLWRSCHDNLTRVLQLLAGLDRAEDDGEGPDFHDAADATGQRRARQRLPLDDLLRSFRLGGRLVWQALIEQARLEGTEAEALVEVATRVWEVIDALSAQVAAAYHAAERQLVRADEQRRATLWEGLLQGRAKDAAFAYEAARIVRLPVDGPFVVVSAGDRNVTDGLTEALGERLDAAGIRSAWQARSDTLVGLLALPASTPTSTAEAVAVLRELLDVPVGISLVVSGLAEVDLGFRQATLARRTVPPAHSGAAGLASLSDRLPEALLLSSPELTEPLVQRWLGPLLDLPVRDRRLYLHTLRTWTETAGSTTRTAEALHCHRNTVINRIRRLEDLLGHSLSGDDLPVELALALRALPFYPLS